MRQRWCWWSGRWRNPTHADGETVVMNGAPVVLVIRGCGWGHPRYRPSQRIGALAPLRSLGVTSGRLCRKMGRREGARMKIRRFAPLVFVFGAGLLKLHGQCTSQQPIAVSCSGFNCQGQYSQPPVADGGQTTIQLFQSDAAGT
jgi:hypothetical protein